MTDVTSGTPAAPDTHSGAEEARAGQTERLLKENEELRTKLERTSGYIRGKVNQLLDIMGTMPLKTEELDDEMLVEFDPLGIICDSFRHVLDNLHATNRQLNSANEQTKAIFAAAEVGILHIDKNRKILSCNNKLMELFLPEKGENDVVGRFCHDLVCEGELPEEGCSFNQIIQGGARSRLRNWAFRGRVFDVSGTPVLDQEGRVESIVLVYHDITERRKAEEELRENHLFVEELLKNAPVGIRVFDGDSGRCLLLNQVTADIAGGNVEVMQRQNFRELASWQTSGLQNVSESVLSDGSTRTVRVDMLTSFGKQVSVEYIVSRFYVKEKPHLLVIGRDITLEKQLAEKNRKIEEQMLHVQKLESLGVLAGGIAHDFNNILLAILGNAELALMRLVPESPARSNLLQIEKAAQRAADLAQQMLAYSGRGHFVIERLDINAMITEMSQILEVSISKKAAMRVNLADNLPLFEGDATQIRQILMNLVINASDAIGDGNGVIAITTGAMKCDRAYLSKIWLYDRLEEGTYLYFEVADTGCGMDQETMAKIFDPFFTTKFTGRGLGMAAVLGIVRGHHGAITLYSELGKGTSFKVFLPAAYKASALSTHTAAPGRQASGSGAVLLVDDEEAILELGRGMLEELGYSVFTAMDGVEAVEVFKGHREAIVCVILDLTMPRLDGEQTFRELQRIDPQVLVVMSSGFNEQEVTRKFVGKGVAGFIQKPYKLAELSGKLKAVVPPQHT